MVAMKKVVALTLISFSGLLGCADDPGPVTDPGEGIAPMTPGQGTTRDELASPLTLSLMPGGTADVTARRTFDGDTEETTELATQNGALTVHALGDGQVVIDDLHVSLGDIHLSPTSVPPTGLDLKDVQLSLKNGMPASARWTDDGYAVVVDGTVDLMLDWSLLGEDGSIVPLATQRITDVPLQIDLVPDTSGRLRAVVHATRDGVFWGWTGLLELSDLALDVQATK